MTISTQFALMPPSFDHQGPQMTASVGHVLPPSLEEADAGESADSGPLLPVSWQRLHRSIVVGCRFAAQHHRPR